MSDIDDQELKREVRETIEAFLGERLPSFDYSGASAFFDEVPEGEPRGEDSLVGTIRLDLQKCAAFFGRSAGELREMGYLKGNEEVPDCAVLGPGGFEWIELDLVIDPEGVKSVLKEEK